MRLYSRSLPPMARILASDSIEPICGKVFKDRGHELVERPGIQKDELIKIIGDFDGLVVRSGTKVTKDIINAASNLKIIGRAGTGVDNIDVRSATSKGILVVNTPGGNTISTAELALTHILALARNIPQATAALKAGRWDRAKYTGTELTGKTLGVLGVGKIGREVAKWCIGFGMNVVGYDPVLAESSARSHGIEPVTVDQLLAKSDFITIHTPLTNETHHLFNTENLSKCKKGVRIVNCARGGIIDEHALLTALNSGQVGGAGLDVLEVEPPTDSSKDLRMHPNVIVSPHLGAGTVDAQERVAKAIAENMSDILDGGSFVGVVNSPDLGAIAKLEHVVPYVLLAERIGVIQGQLLHGNKIGAISIHLRGKDIADSKLTDVVKSAVIKGTLSELGIANVSYVNAMATAEEMGLKVLLNISEKTDATSGYMNTVGVDLEIEGLLNASRAIEGTVFGANELRITRIDGYAIDLPPGENILLFNNRDQPGVLRKIVEKLAAAQVNIAHFALGRRERGQKAMGAIVLDTPVPPEVMNDLRTVQEISNVMELRLKDSIDPNFRVRSASQGQVAGPRKPLVKPRNPEFSSGPCKKRPGYSLNALRTDVLGRSHRSKLGKSRLKRAIEDTKRILEVPDDYLCGIVAASDTGAFEMAMWNMLGSRPLDACYWESFGKGWADDAVKQLGLKDSMRIFKADYGQLPDLSRTNPDHDITFTFNGTTSGVRVPNMDWVRSDRQGLVLNDATSAAFAMDMHWPKLDVTTFSWQKVLGGEGAHGMLILSPAAVQRLETFDPQRPLPKFFRLTKKDQGVVKLDKAIFTGDTINTPSMLCVEDYLDALAWADSVGGLQGLIKRSTRNLRILEQFVAQNDWIEFLAADPAVRSNTSVCLTLALSKDQVKKFVGLLEAEGVAYDIGSYRDAPDGLRIWCGATVEAEDLESLLPWLKWAYEVVKA